MNKPIRTKSKKRKKNNKKKVTKKWGGAAFQSEVPTVTFINAFYNNGRYLDFYKVHCNNCDYYIRDHDKNEYITIMFNGSQYLFKLNKMGESRMLSQDEFSRLVEELKSKYNPTTPLDYKRIFQLEKILTFIPGECIQYMDLEIAKRKISELNERLNVKCKNLRLSLDYVYNLDVPQGGVLQAFFSTGVDGLMLCLHNETGCISSILLKIDNSQLELFSTTGRSYYQKGYNNLLRCVVLILARFIPQDIQTVVSDAVNSISAITLLKHFGGYIPVHTKNEDFIHFKQQVMSSGNTLDEFQMIDKFLNPDDDKLCSLLVYVDLLEDTSEEYEEKLQFFIDKTKCE